MESSAIIGISVIMFGSGSRRPNNKQQESEQTRCSPDNSNKRGAPTGRRSTGQAANSGRRKARTRSAVRKKRSAAAAAATAAAATAAAADRRAAAGRQPAKAHGVQQLDRVVMPLRAGGRVTGGAHRPGKQEGDAAGAAAIFIARHTVTLPRYPGDRGDRGEGRPQTGYPERLRAPASGRPSTPTPAGPPPQAPAAQRWKAAVMVAADAAERSLGRRSSCSAVASRE